MYSPGLERKKEKPKIDFGGRVIRHLNAFNRQSQILSEVTYIAIVSLIILILF